VLEKTLVKLTNKNNYRRAVNVDVSSFGGQHEILNKYKSVFTNKTNITHNNIILRIKSLHMYTASLLKTCFKY